MIMSIVLAKTKVVVLAAAFAVTARVLGRAGEVPSTRESGGAGIARSTTFAERYGLKEDEVIKLVKPPFGSESMAFFRDQREGDLTRESSEDELLTMRVTWDGDVPRLEDARVEKGATGYLIREIFLNVMRVSPAQIEGDRGILNKRLVGDLVVRGSVKSDAYAAGLSKLIQEELGERVKLQPVTVERDVIVIKGEWDEGKPVGAPQVGHTEPLRIFGSHEKDRRSYVMRSSYVLDLLATDLSTFLDRQVVVEVTVPAGKKRPASLLWRVPLEPDPTEENAQMALNQIEQQIGWKWSIAKRKVTRLVVEKLD